MSIPMLILPHVIAQFGMQKFPKYKANNAGYGMKRRKVGCHCVLPSRERPQLAGLYNQLV
jgi:hypothetical protein